MSRQKNILVTGHKGFIGSRLFKDLSDRGYKVWGYDLVDGDDVRDKFKLSNLFANINFDSVIHLAARAGVLNSAEFPNEYISTNIEGTKNIVDLCEKHGVENLIFYSSSSVLGGGIGLAEDAGYSPKSLYGITKVAGEMIVKSSKLNYIIIRPFTAYGLNGRNDEVVYRWINQINAGKSITFYGDGETCRGYTHVDDLVLATRILLREMPNIFFDDTPDAEFSGLTAGTVTAIDIGVTGNIGNRIFHVGGSEVVSLSHLKDLFLEVSGNKNIEIDFTEMDLMKEDVRSSSANTSKFFHATGIELKENFDDNIRNILDIELC